MSKFSVATLFIAVALIPSFANAKMGVTLLTSFIEERVEPGQVLSTTIRIESESTQEQILFLSVRDIESMDESGRPIYANENQESSEGQLSSWVTFPLSSITLSAGQAADATVRISIPANAPHGGHFAAIIFSTEPPPLESDDSALTIGYGVGTIISLRVGEDATDKAILREFRAEPRVGSGPGVMLKTRIENTGTALIRPTGLIEVSNMFGRFIASVSFNNTAGAILPNTVRRYETGWQGEGFLLGRYTADLVVRYGDETKKTLIGTTYFWILPAKPLIYGVGGALAVFFILFTWIRMYIRRKLRDVGAPVPVPGRSGGRGFIEDQSLGRPSSLLIIFVPALIVFAIALVFAFLFLA